jgi:hypothetical protein
MADEKKKLTSAQKLKLGKFLSREMDANKKKKPEEQRDKDQMLAVGYSKIRSGEL